MNVIKKSTQPGFIKIFLTAIIVYLIIILIIEYVVGKYFIVYLSGEIEAKRKEEMIAGWNEFFNQKKLEHKNKIIGYSWWTEIADAFEAKDIETILNQDFEGDPSLIKDCDVFLAIDKNFELICASIDGVLLHDDPLGFQSMRNIEREKEFFELTEKKYIEHLSLYHNDMEKYRKINKVISKQIAWNFIEVYNGRLRLLTLTPICSNQGYPLTKGFMLYGQEIQKIQDCAGKIIPASIKIDFIDSKDAYLSVKISGIDNAAETYVTFEPYFKISDISGNVLLIFIIGQAVLLTITLALIFPFFTKKYVRNLEKIVKERTQALNDKNIHLESANEEILQQKAEIEAQRDEILNQRDLVIKQKEEIDGQQKELVKAFKESSKQQVQLHRAMIEISEQKKQITDSIQYAQRIQAAILPPYDFLKKLLPQSFVLYKPKDIVSGDFYWVNKKDDKLIIAVGDCTGHGVPGAFMSIIGINFLNEIIIEKGILQPSAILDELKMNVIKTLHQSHIAGESKDGMDIVLCIFDNANSTIQFAGANNPLYMITGNKPQVTDLEITKPVVHDIEFNGAPGHSEVKNQDPCLKLYEIKGDKMPIGIYSTDDKPFSNHCITVNEGDILYLFSDGYSDQIGGENEKKLKAHRFRQIIFDACHKEISEQKEFLDIAFENWKGKHEQIDDVLIMGIKI